MNRSEMDGWSSRHPPLEWHPGLYSYDPYTNTLLPLPSYGYGFGVEYRWNPANQQQGPMENSYLPLGRPPQVQAQRGRRRGGRQAQQGRGGRFAQRGRGGRHRNSQPCQNGGPGLLGSNPSSQRPPQLPPTRTRAPDEPSSSQPPVQVQAQVPVPLPPENKDLSPPPPPASSSPSSHAMTLPMSDPVKNSHVDVSMTADANKDDAQDDELVGLNGSSTATNDKKRFLKLDPPAPMKNSDVDVSMARRDDGHGDILGLNVYMAKKKRMFSTKASSLPADGVAEEDAKAAATKKTRLGWGQGLAKYEHCRFKKDDETTNKIVAHDGTTGEAASSHGSPLIAAGDHDDPGKDGLHVSPAKVPAPFSNKHRPSPDGDLDSTRKNGNTSSLTEKADSAGEVPSRFAHKHSPSPAGGILDRGSVFPKVSDVPGKGSLPPEDNSISSSSMTAVAVPELASSSQGCDAPPDESSMKFTKVEDIPPRKEKVIVKMARKARPILKTNVLSDEEAQTNELQGSKLKDWSQQEKDVFSEMITAFGKNFPKVSAFLRHKTPSDCRQYYFEQYKSEGHKEAQKCLPTTVMESEENCSNAAPSPLNIPQSVLIENGDEGNCLADGSCGEDTTKLTGPKDNPCNTSDPAAMLTGPAFGQHVMELDEAMGKKETEKNDNKLKGKEGNNLVFCVASKHGSGIQLSCEVDSQGIEKVDSVPSLERNGHNADMKNPTKDSSPCVATNAAVVQDDLIQRLRASDAMTCQKGKGILSCPDGNNYYAPPLYISNEASRAYHLPSSPGSAALDIVHAPSSHIAMNIDLNIPLDVTSVDLGNSNAAASMGCSSEATETDSDATMEIISPSQTTTTVPQTSQQQPANQPGSIMLFGQIIYQAPSTGTTNHTPNQQVNQTVVPVTRRRGGQVYPSWTTTTSVWGSSVPNNQQGQQAVLSNRMPYGGSTNGASASAALPLQLQPQGSSALANMIQQRRQQALVNITNGASTSAASPLQLQPQSSAIANMILQQRQQALVNITPNIILGGGVPIMPSHLIQGSSDGAGLLNFNNGFSSAQQRWTYPVMETSRVVVDTSRVVIGHPFYYPGANTNQAPATALTIASIGINNGEGTSTSNARASPPEQRGRGPNSTWLSLHRN